MKISSDNLVSQLLFGSGSKSQSRGPLADGTEIAKLAQNSGGLKQAAISAFQSSPGIQPVTTPPEEIPDPSPSVPTSPDPVDTAPVDQQPDVEDDTTLKSLAARYVALYEKNSGNSLSDTEEQELIEDVAEFYSETDSRQGRLATLVNSLEQVA